MYQRQNIRDIARAYDSMGAVMNPWGRRDLRDIADSHPRTGNYGYGAPAYNPAMAAYAAMQGGGGGMVAPPGAATGQWGGMSPADYAQYVANGCQVPCCPVAEPQYQRIGLVGLPEVCIPECECGVLIETTVCGQFTPLGLYIPPKIAHCLSITRFRVGCTDLLLGCDPVPAELFSCCEMDDNIIGGPSSAANTQVCITVDNKCKADIEFGGALKVAACLPCG